MNVVCYSHLRWNFVYQRPQHLMSRFAKTGTVYFIEEPLHDSDHDWLEVQEPAPGIFVLTPHFPAKMDHETIDNQQVGLLGEFFAGKDLGDHIAWFYTPMSLPLLDALPEPGVIVYDCMDELSNFDFAPANLKQMEKKLFEKADVVFTGGKKLFLSKKSQHSNIHPFPSSIDKAHFAQARQQTAVPSDQQAIPAPCLGFFGVIDERLDIALLKDLALLRPQWNIVLLGPVVKIDPNSLPQLPNIHYLGQKDYAELPAYLAAWDVALIPFAISKSTEFISPTKTPEYLAGGTPVVSTPIHDVADPYGILGIVYIANNAKEFVEGVEWALRASKDHKWLQTVDRFLADNSWDDVWKSMTREIRLCLRSKQQSIQPN